MRPTAQELFDHTTESHALFERLLAEGRGIIVVTGHCGNWEMGSFLMRRTVAAQLTIIAMAEASPDVNRIRNSIRERLGAETLEVRQSLDTALQIRRRLGDNQMVAVLMDRHLGRDRVGVTLLGRHAWFLRTPALMSYLTGAPLLPCFINRAGPGRFTVHLGDPIRVSRDRPARRSDSAARRRTSPISSASACGHHPDHWYHFYRVLGRAARFVRRARLTALAMDPVSHVIFGRTLIALDRRGRFGAGAIAAAVLGALAPDIDVLAVWRGWDVYLRVHEIGTHSIVGSVASDAPPARSSIC